eukprot:CAMPEP_0202702238 /NCGR_PEP_ID=MMETSP1385-20130828/15263_1 /ASSEMBLY_ACC=CAM_ASM_000861 /TAXON_ID=933848 /ORGANISM="Elphidium margaritaceum" /LENGTH=230 /DNA_ID=CAMNT_0049359855 /DNA_START=40 /DNA_END=729 /DNA_ORIENTATION=+
MTWNEAETYCVTQYGTHLASIHTADDNLQAKFDCGDIYCWIGLNDCGDPTDCDINNYGSGTEGTFVWIDGTSYDYGNWDTETGQPDNNDADEDCVSFKPGSTKWYDFHCKQYPSAFICNPPQPTLDPTASSVPNPTPGPSPVSTTTTLSPANTASIDNLTQNALDEWIIKDGGNCGDGFEDLPQEHEYYGVFCQPCPEGTAGSYGKCNQCGTLEEANTSRTECEFYHPWW